MRRALLLAALLAPASASARRGDLRLSLEPGLASLSGAGGRAWGWLGGASGAVGLADLLAFEIHVDDKRFSGARTEILTYGAAVTYAIDLLPITPILAFGFARARIRARGAVADESAALLGLGVDARLSRYLTAGVLFRYYPLFDSDLSAPAYSSMNARIGLVWGDP